ncbi:MAG: hypothetical protein IT355_03205 [Gemmatimonadaceae bacterium]|nr:hypothetical protein [Gemmatimonadaceae bacterium]
MSILPTPLHPAIVHLPIAIAVLAPLFALAALWAIRRGITPRWAWSVPVALLAVLMVSGWAALQTGDADHERVEDRLGEQVVETHEEAAEAFLAFAGAVLGISAAGFLAGRAGSAARVIGTVGTVALLAVGYNVGHTGGKLAYPDATSPATVSAGGSSSEPARSGTADDDDDDDDDN